MKHLNLADLTNHFQELKNKTLLELFAEEKGRNQLYSLAYNGLHFDFSKNKINQSTLAKLLDLTKQVKLSEHIEAMFSGQKINNTENRAVLHTALRSEETSVLVDGRNVINDISSVKKQMKSFCQKLHSGEHAGFSGKKITHIINIGIGGSDLGPVLVCQALKPYRQAGMKIDFISSVDGYMLNDILADIDPETTLFVIASKTFTTQETMTNAMSARKWFLSKTANNTAAIAQHFIALSTNEKAVTEFGIAKENMFAFWDFVGGRYSLWSAIGLSIALYIGYDNFEQLLAGANSMDKHFRETSDFSQNIPVILALLGIWYVNFFDYNSLILSPYNTRLTRFPAYVQQLEMESNGKSVDKNGQRISYNTCPVVWGDSGINGQHAYYQLLHQGSQIIPMDIIIALSDRFSNKEHNDILWSNAVAQAEAFMCGKTYETAKAELLSQGMSSTDADEIAKHKIFDGNRPSNMIVLPEISPYYLGMLIALYEHKTFVQGVIWNINSFDQMGVELGKQLAKAVLKDIETAVVSNHDESTVAIIQHYLNFISK
ncbi:glucose-6-phosphate isomerase [Aquella oligotrophica]|uniref:Glucose-6-phosphate isomerase n=1 Tax=Aquella oligotrophica TaxID=2067065 RepID=A0A2I7N5L4_9NEIS|nr:glucose-6-phosphate isomerase [Aquella oligotrophica]AUR51739.1 glucose-6-phosphate isomerase [Aquella oligotrophica]